MSQLNEWGVDALKQCVTQNIACVRALGEAGELFVDGLTTPVQRAASCLLAPAVGDSVLLAQTIGGQSAWVLAVLVRAAPDTVAELNVQGTCDAQLSAMGALTLVAGDTLAQSATHYALIAEHADINVEQVKLRSRLMRWIADAVEATTRTFDSVTERYTLRARTSLRVVAESDHTRAGQVDVQAESGLMLSGEHALIHARGLAKVHGKQVHVG